MTNLEKLAQMGLAIALFVALLGLVLLVSGRVRRRGELLQILAFLIPALGLLTVGLIYPAVRTIYQSFLNRTSDAYVGLDNYVQVFTTQAFVDVLRNTAIWVLITPFLSTFIGLVYAVLVDRARFEAFAKAVIFLPMAISLVGASIIWKFVYEFRPDQQGINQIGLLNQFLVWLGFEPQQFVLVNPPLNSLFLIVVMVWVQAGFAMTVLSAAIKAIPSDITEAAQLDGLSGVKMFRYITVPSIRPALVVVLTTIAIITLKAFDIVRTMTGGQFSTSVVANEFYTQGFRLSNTGVASALAVLLFILVVPVVAYNVRQLRKADYR